MRRSGAPPRYPIGQHVVSVSTGAGSRCSAGAPRLTTVRPTTRHVVVPCSVNVLIVSPIVSSPSRRKCRSRCAEMTEFPVRPGTADAGRWPGPPFSAASVTPSKTMSSRPTFGMTRRATGVPMAGSERVTVGNDAARPRSTAARAMRASHSDRARSCASQPLVYERSAYPVSAMPAARSASAAAVLPLTPPGGEHRRTRDHRAETQHQ